MSENLTERKPEQAIQPLPAVNSVQSAEALMAHHAPKKPKRTLGLHVVDSLIYPGVNNVGVFGISLIATYLTDHGWPARADGKELNKAQKFVGDAFRKRGQVVEKFLQNFGMSEKSAGMARMVFFSFTDGSLIAPLVKLLEDRREKMALRIDTTFGTKPNDESVYDVEPKQGWGSVIEGRLLTSLVVVPTAVALNHKLKDGESLNDKLFNNPGVALGEKVEREIPRLKSGIEHIAGKVHFPTLFKIAIFEMVYTSICTAGLYFISRKIASKHPPKHYGHVHEVSQLDNFKHEKPEITETESLALQPQTRVSAISHQQKVNEHLQSTLIST